MNTTKEEKEELISDIDFAGFMINYMDFMFFLEATKEEN